MTAQYALAKAMATMDGKLTPFLAEADGVSSTSPAYTGHFDGYMAEAAVILEDLNADGFTVVSSNS